MMPGMIQMIMQGVTGLGQLIAGAASQPKRPVYSAPASALDALRLSKRLAGQTKLPGQDQAELELGEQTANMTGAIESMGAGGAGLGALSSIYSQEARMRRKLLGDASKYYASNQGQLYNALNNYARYQDKEWQKNVGDKYEEGAAASSALIEAGLSNLSSSAGKGDSALSYGSLMGGMS